MNDLKFTTAGDYMNERIEQLAVQAGFKNVVGVLDGKVELQKFAELIVRECMSDLYLNGYDDAMIQIQKHFGVEE